MAGFIAVHTGAGNCIDESKYQRVIKEACMRATEILRNGGSAVDACEAAIMRLENCGNTNAGFGSNLCLDGTVQCDAAIMDGTTLNFGACTNVSRVKNPIQLARRICDGQSEQQPLERIPPMVLAASGAEQYAEQQGCAMIEPNVLISSKAKFHYNHYKSKFDAVVGNHSKAVVEDADVVPEPGNEVELSAAPLDTVGAVCVDGAGNTAAGCSSGGILLKMPGRVGQAATYGAGCWASDTDELAIATCTTGNGEYLMKTLLAREICYGAFDSDCAVTSLHKTFKQKFLDSPLLPQQQDLYAGALTLLYYPKQSSGEVMWSHTTQSFCVGYMATTQKVPKFVHSPLPTYSVPGRSCVVNGHNFHLRI
ncbi:threonine aspartase 1 [Drosophila albomicans]|uniref:Threonine aspartase 1 n=1 Tax=Drosophila albomicans TaxID=7291 RepID=A0A6P8WW19_DROAB|nr:threonine aspartase 1 [Drosophila albomicans]